MNDSFRNSRENEGHFTPDWELPKEWSIEESFETFLTQSENIDLWSVCTISNALLVLRTVAMPYNAPQRCSFKDDNRGPIHGRN